MSQPLDWREMADEDISRESWKREATLRRAECAQLRDRILTLEVEEIPLADQVAALTAERDAAQSDLRVAMADVRGLQNERDDLAEKLAVCLEMPNEDIPLVKESEVWRAWLSERNAAFIQIVEQDKALERIAAAFKEIQKRCPDCKGERYVTTYASDGYPEGEECERCNVVADKVLAARDVALLEKAEGRLAAVRNNMGLAELKKMIAEVKAGRL